MFFNRLIPSLICIAFFSATALFAAGDAAKGKAVYDKSCRSCHGPEGKGNPAIAKSLKVEFRDFASKEVQALKDDELKKKALGPTEKKKPVKNVTPEQLEDVVAFVRSLAKK